MTAAASKDEVFAREVAGVVVEALNLDMKPAELDLDASLFGEGLGLDSIDILEMALVISKKYGIELRADDEDNMQIFASLRTLADYVARHRVTQAAA
jgi:acyl carrier protein